MASLRQPSAGELYIASVDQAEAAAAMRARKLAQRYAAQRVCSALAAAATPSGSLADVDALIASLTSHDAASDAGFADAGALLNSQGTKGDTPLHVAARQAHVEAVQLLLDRGATCASSLDIHGETALFAARGAKNPAGDACMRRMLAPRQLSSSSSDGPGENAAAIVNCASARDGATVLQKCVFDDRPDAVRLLLAHGADPALKNNRGVDCYALARAIGASAEVRALLLTATASRE